MLYKKKMENGLSGIHSSCTFWQKHGIDFFSFVCVLYEVHSWKEKQRGKLHLCTSSRLLMCVNTRFLKLVCTVYRVSVAMKTSLQLVL